MRHQRQSSSPSKPTLDSVFSQVYLARLREREESITAGEAEYAGP